MEKKDYLFFTSLLSAYLTPKLPLPEMMSVRNTVWWRSKLKLNEVKLLAYCLMPNHFHLLLQQSSIDGITKFMRRITNAYVSYFNTRNERTGALFQGKFKASLIEQDSYLLHLSRYIHSNPLEVRPLTRLEDYPYSSYREYLGLRHTSWIKMDDIISYFIRSFPNAKSKQSSAYLAQLEK